MEDYEDKLAKVRLPAEDRGLFSRNNLKPFPDDYTLDQIIIDSVKEGEILILVEEKLKDKAAGTEAKKLETKLGSSSPNPYIRARCEIISKMPESRRLAIEQMEKGEKPKNHVYDDFVKEVTKLGDKLSDITIPYNAPTGT